MPKRPIAALVAIVAAVSLLLPGQPAAASAAIALPGVPLAVVAQSALGGRAVVRWVAPTTGGAPTGYRIDALLASGEVAQTRTCFSGCREVWIGDLTVGLPYTFKVQAVNSQGGGTVVTVAATVLPDAAPLPVTMVKLVPTTTADSYAVMWKASNLGVAATKYSIAIRDVATNAWIATVGCEGYRCMAERIPGLTPGRKYKAIVRAGNAVGSSLPVTFAMTTPVATGCATANACVTVESKGVVKTRLTHAAQGFIYGNWDPLPDGTVAELKPQFWRVSTGIDDYTAFDRVRATGAKVVITLSDAWRGGTYSSVRGGALPPMSDPARYRAWVRLFVGSVLEDGRRPDYWEVQNEPGAPNYLNAADTAALTVDDMHEQFRIAYEEIMALDPTAKVIGPSIGWYLSRPDPADLEITDIQRFLEYSEAHGIRPAALVWHEINLTAWHARDFASLPVNIVDHVAEVRALAAEYDVGTPEILITEYADEPVHHLPGWTVGYIANLEAAGVDGAMRSCWGTECYLSQYNGLLTPEGTPLANYWIHRFYAAMGSSRLTATASKASLSVLAARDDATWEVRTLIGRHETCSLNVQIGCARRLRPSPPPSR